MGIYSVKDIADIVFQKPGRTTESMPWPKHSWHGPKMDEQKKEGLYPLERAMWELELKLKFSKAARDCHERLVAETGRDLILGRYIQKALKEIQPTKEEIQQNLRISVKAPDFAFTASEAPYGFFTMNKELQRYLKGDFGADLYELYTKALTTNTPEQPWLLNTEIPVPGRL